MNSGGPESRLVREPLSRQLEDALRLDIVSGAYRPGERLRFSDLGARYGVSATPLREALPHLAADGLVVLESGFGARVAEASIDDLRDIYSAREVIDSAALRLSIELGGDEWRAALTTEMAALRRASRALSAKPTRIQIQQWSRAHREFELALFSACPSQWLLRFSLILYEHAERYRMLTLSGSAPRNTEIEHERIFQPAVAGDADDAVAAMAEHLQLTVRLLEEGLDDGAGWINSSVSRREPRA